MTRFLTTVGAFLLLTACGSGTTINLRNGSEQHLTDVTVWGEGYRASLGSIAPGQSRKFVIYPSGETGVAVSFSAEGRVYLAEPRSYFEGGGLYKVALTISREMTVEVDVRTGLQ